MRVRQSQGDGSSGSLRTSNATRLQSALSEPLRCGHSIAAGVGNASARSDEKRFLPNSYKSKRKPTYSIGNPERYTSEGIIGDIGISRSARPPLDWGTRRAARYDGGRRRQSARGGVRDHFEHTGSRYCRAVVVRA